MIFKVKVLLSLAIPIVLLVDPTMANESLNKKDYSEVARNRLYAGGSQEEDIKVKEELEDPLILLDKNTIDQSMLNEYRNGKTKSGNQ